MGIHFVVFIRHFVDQTFYIRKWYFIRRRCKTVKGWNRSKIANKMKWKSYSHHSEDFNILNLWYTPTMNTKTKTARNACILLLSLYFWYSNIEHWTLSMSSFWLCHNIHLFRFATLLMLWIQILKSICLIITSWIFPLVCVFSIVVSSFPEFPLSFFQL